MANNSKTTEKTKKTLREQLEEYRPRMDKMYWIFLTIILLYDRLGTTPLLGMVRQWFGTVVSDIPSDLAELLFNNFLNLRYMILVPALYTLILDIKGWKKKTVAVLLLAFGAFYAYYWKKTNDTIIFEITILMVASYGKDFKKIVYRGLALTMGVVVLAATLSVCKVLPDYTLGEGKWIRHSFGTFHYSDLAAHFCFVVMLYVFVKNGVLKTKEYLIAAILIALNAVFLKGWNSLVCSVLTLLGCAVAFQCRKQEKDQNSMMRRIGTAGFVISFILFTAIYMLLNFTYKEESWAIFQGLGPMGELRERLHVSANVTRVLPFSWFGKFFLQIGNRGDNTANGVSFYTYLECSYVRIYVMYGVIALAFFMTVFTGIQCRLAKKGTLLQMFLLFLVAAHAILEQRLIDPAYDLFLLLPFVALDQQGKNTEVSKT